MGHYALTHCQQLENTLASAVATGLAYSSGSLPAHSYEKLENAGITPAMVFRFLNNLTESTLDQKGTLGDCSPPTGDGDDEG